MNPNRTQDLAEAFASIISMMLGMIRAQGWRSLRNLPALWMTAILLRRIGKEFAALIAAFQAGTLIPLAPAPAPAIAPTGQESTGQESTGQESTGQESTGQESATASSPAPPRPNARRDPSAQDCHRPAERGPSLAACAEPDRPCAAAAACPAITLPHARARVAAWPPRRMQYRPAVRELAAGVIATARSR